MKEIYSSYIIEKGKGNETYLPFLNNVLGGIEHITYEINIADALTKIQKCTTK